MHVVCIKANPCDVSCYGDSFSTVLFYLSDFTFNCHIKALTDRSIYLFKQCFVLLTAAPDIMENSGQIGRQKGLSQWHHEWGESLTLPRSVLCPIWEGMPRCHIMGLEIRPFVLWWSQTMGRSIADVNSKYSAMTSIEIQCLNGKSTEDTIL